MLRTRILPQQPWTTAIYRRKERSHRHESGFLPYPSPVPFWVTHKTETEPSAFVILLSWLSPHNNYFCQIRICIHSFVSVLWVAQKGSRLPHTYRMSAIWSAKSRAVFKLNLRLLYGLTSKPLRLVVAGNYIKVPNQQVYEPLDSKKSNPRRISLTRLWTMQKRPYLGSPPTSTVRCWDPYLSYRFAFVTHLPDLANCENVEQILPFIFKILYHFDRVFTISENLPSEKAWEGRKFLFRFIVNF